MGRVKEMFYVASEPSQRRRRRLVDEILEDDQLLPPTPSNGLTHQSNGNTGTPAAPHPVPNISTPPQPAPSTNISPGAQSPSNLNVDATDSTGGKKDDPPHPVSSTSTPPQPVSPVVQSSSNVNVDATNSTGGKKDDPPHPVPSTSTPPQPAPSTNVSPVAQSPSNLNVDATNFTGGKKDNPYSGGGFFDLSRSPLPPSSSDPSHLCDTLPTPDMAPPPVDKPGPLQESRKKFPSVLHVHIPKAFKKTARTAEGKVGTRNKGKERVDDSSATDNMPGTQGTPSVEVHSQPSSSAQVRPPLFKRLRRQSNESIELHKRLPEIAEVAYGQSIPAYYSANEQKIKEENERKERKERKDRERNEAEAKKRRERDDAKKKNREEGSSATQNPFFRLCGCA